MTIRDMFNQIEDVVRDILETHSNFDKETMEGLIKDIMKDCEYNATKIIYEGLQEYEKNMLTK